jgi:hypothetical protein
MPRMIILPAPVVGWRNRDLFEFLDGDLVLLG